MDKTILTTTLLLGLVGIIALNIKQFLGWVWNLILDNVLYTLKVEESSQFFYAIQNFITIEHQNKIKNAYYRTIYDNFIDGETTRNIQLFYSRGLLLFKTPDGGWILLSKTSMTISNSHTPYKNDKQSFHLFAFKRSTMINLVAHIRTNYVNNNIRYYFNNNGEIMVYGNILNKTFNNIFLKDEIKSAIINDVDKFTKSEEQYKKLGLKYKRTYLFHGVAGSGKSSISVAIANHTKRDVLTINVSKDMTDSTLISLIARRPQKSIILFEDIDCLFEEISRANNPSEDKEKTPQIKITLSCLLNILDGSFTPNDVIFIITTNHLEKLDPALKRDGRINMMLEIGLPDKKTKMEYVKHIKQNNSNFKLESVNLDDDISISTLEKNIF